MDASKTIEKKPSLFLTNILLVVISVILLGNLFWTPPNEALVGEASTPVPTVAPEVQEWEYKFVRVDSLSEGPFGGYLNIQSDGGTKIGLEGNTVTLKAINQLGNEGWELVSVIHNYGETGANLVFKRLLSQK